MENYDTYTFVHTSHNNEYAPDVVLTFTTHMEESIDEVIEMVAQFLYACGYSEGSIRSKMAEYSEY